MSKKRKHLLTKVNALIVGILSAMGILTFHSCAYGVPPDCLGEEPDSLQWVVCKYGVPADTVPEESE